MNYYQFHIADFALHTSHLSLEEEGVYRRLLDYYYDTESPIPTETDPVIRRLRLANQKEIVESILQEFFVLRDDGWHNLRADSEILEYKKKANRARENGKNGGRPKKNKQLQNEKPRKTDSVILDNPEITGSKANQEPRTINQEPDNNMSGKPDPALQKNTELKTTAKTVLEFLNQKTGRNYKPVDANISMIIARLKEGYTDSDCRKVIAKKCREWNTDEKMVLYLRPKTLFNKTNLANYVGELVEVRDE